MHGPRLSLGALNRVGFEPVVWQPPADLGFTGDYRRNTLLERLQRWPLPTGTGPEDVAVDAEGRVWTGTADGTVWRFDTQGRAEAIAVTGGRPLGIEALDGGAVLVCDAERGLLRIDPDGALVTLATAAGGVPLGVCNNAAVASDGTIWFTDSSQRWSLAEHETDLLEHAGTGRLCRLEAGASAAEVVFEGLQFPNGVALAPDETFLLVAQTGRYAIDRVQLSGNRAGATTPFVENLPGFPDNLSTGPTGTFWCALVAPRNPALDRLLPLHAARILVANAPDRLKPKPARYAAVAGFDADGRVVANLQGPSGRYAQVTGARERDGWLCLGSLTEDAVARVPLPARERPPPAADAP